MRDIAIFGAGGFGREVACLIRMINESRLEPEWKMIGKRPNLGPDRILLR